MKKTTVLAFCLVVAMSAALVCGTFAIAQEVSDGDSAQSVPFDVAAESSAEETA